MTRQLFLSAALLLASGNCTLDGGQDSGSGLTGDEPGLAPNVSPPRSPDDAPLTGSGLYRYQGVTDARIDLRQWDEKDFVDVALDAGGKTSLEMNGLAGKPATQLKAGVQFTPPRAGAYKVSVSFSIVGADGGNYIYAQYRLSDGATASPAMLYQRTLTGEDAMSSHTLTWAFTFPGKAPVALRLQEKINASKRIYLAGEQAGMTWLIEEL